MTNGHLITQIPHNQISSWGSVFKRQGSATRNHPSISPIINGLSPGVSLGIRFSPNKDACPHLSPFHSRPPAGTESRFRASDSWPQILLPSMLPSGSRYVHCSLILPFIFFSFFFFLTFISVFIHVCPELENFGLKLNLISGSLGLFSFLTIL